MTSETIDAVWPPYLPYATFMSAVEMLEQGIPPKLDRSMWPSQSGGVQAQLLKAFRFFELTDDAGNVQFDLNRLVEGKDVRKAIMVEFIKRAYPRVIELASVSASTQQLHDAFGAMGVTGQDTRRKAETFFLQAADDADLKLSTHWPAIKKRGGARRPVTRNGTRSSTRSRRSNEGRVPSTPGSQQGTGDVKVLTLASGGTVSLSVAVNWLTVSPEDRDLAH